MSTFDAPERIWVSESGAISGTVNCETNERQTLYIRADLVLVEEKETFNELDLLDYPPDWQG